MARYVCVVVGSVNSPKWRMFICTREAGTDRTLYHKGYGYIGKDCTLLDHAESYRLEDGILIFRPEVEYNTPREAIAILKKCCQVVQISAGMYNSDFRYFKVINSSSDQIKKLLESC